MMVSTRGRYALRIMIDLAEQNTNEYIAMKEIAERQEISLKYIEKVMPLLVRENFLEGVHGKGGGYRLTRKPHEYKIGDILRATEGSLAPVACLDCNAEKCDRADTCPTLPMWTEFHHMVNQYFDSITLSSLIEQERFSHKEQ